MRSRPPHVRAKRGSTYRKVLELGALRMALAAGADLGPVLAEVERLDELAERTPKPSWRELAGEARDGRPDRGHRPHRC
jgi:hypothetical protein